MLRTRDIDLPLPVVWSPPGPFNVEIDELGQGWDAARCTETLIEATRFASRMLRLDWTLRCDERRIRIHGAGWVG